MNDEQFKLLIDALYEIADQLKIISIVSMNIDCEIYEKARYVVSHARLNNDNKTS